MITQHTQERIDRGEISGSVSLVAQDGKLLYAKAQGYANYTRKVPLNTDIVLCHSLCGSAPENRYHLPFGLHDQAHHRRRSHAA